MHISEGILPVSMLIGGYAGAFIGTIVGLKKMDFDEVAKVGLLSASFFVASLIHFPIGFSNIHLTLSGLVGLLLGWASFPAIISALVIQAIMFQYGGITTLGINTMIMGIPAVFCWYSFNFVVAKTSIHTTLAAFICGGLSVLISSLLVACSLLLVNHSGFEKVAVLVVIAHLPMVIVEAIVTACCISFLRKVSPEVLSKNRFLKNN